MADKHYANLKQPEMSWDTFRIIRSRLRRCKMPGLWDKGFLTASGSRESCLTAKLRRHTKGDEATWREQIREVYESVLGENSVTQVAVRPTLKGYVAFDIFTARAWRF